MLRSSLNLCSKEIKIRFSYCLNAKIRTLEEAANDEVFIQENAGRHEESLLDLSIGQMQNLGIAEAGNQNQQPVTNNAASNTQGSRSQGSSANTMTVSAMVHSSPHPHLGRQDVNSIAEVQSNNIRPITTNQQQSRQVKFDSRLIEMNKIELYNHKLSAKL